MSQVPTGLGRLEREKSSGVELPVSVLGGDGIKGKAIGLMLSPVNLVVELDAGQCDFSCIISSKSVTVTITCITKNTYCPCPTFESVLWRAARSPQVG